MKLERIRRAEQLLAHLPRITSRELTICAMVYEAMDTKAIADALGLSERTIQNHRLRIRKKLGLPSAESLRIALVRIVGDYEDR